MSEPMIPDYLLYESRQSSRSSKAAEQESRVDCGCKEEIREFPLGDDISYSWLLDDDWVRWALIHSIYLLSLGLEERLEGVEGVVRIILGARHHIGGKCVFLF